MYKKFAGLNINKRPGPDGLHPKMLYELRAEFLKPVTDLFKLSANEGILPQDWKEAIVTPLFKKGRKAKPENYRSVSLTSILRKMLESIIKDQISIQGYSKRMNRFHYANFDAIV